MTVRLIAHVLIQSGDDYLLIKRSEIKRGFSNVYPTYWDIPGGGVKRVNFREMELLENVLKKRELG